MALEDLKSFLYKDEAKKKESLESKSTTLTTGQVVKQDPLDKKTSNFYKKEELVRQDLGKKTSLYSNPNASIKLPVPDISRKGSFYRPFEFNSSGIFSTYPQVSTGGSGNITSDRRTTNAGGSLSSVIPPNSDSNVVAGPATYELQIALQRKEASTGRINIYYSIDEGVTWKTFITDWELQYHSGGVFYIGRRGEIKVTEGDNLWVTVEDYVTEADVVFGRGMFTGDFTSRCGRANPAKFLNISTQGKVFAATINVNVVSGNLVFCGTVDDYYYGDDTNLGYHDEGYFGES